MTDPALDLQQSVFKTLLQDVDFNAALGNGRVFDRVPERVKPPYVVIGRSIASDWSTATEGGEAIVLFIHTWSNSPSRTQTHQLQDHIKRIMGAPLLPLTDHHLVNLRFQLAETRRDRRTRFFHGILRFRAVTEPV